MHLYEFEAKRLLAKHGIPIPASAVAESPADVERAASAIGFPVVLKAQVLARALARKSGVASVANPAEARRAAEALLELDDGRRKPRGILVEKKIAGSKECSLAVTYDGTLKRPVLAAADRGGALEEIAEQDPDRVVRRHFSALLPFSDYLAKEVARALGLKGADLTGVTTIVARLAQLFLKYDL